MQTLPETNDNPLLLLHTAVDELATRAMLGENPANPGSTVIRSLISLAQDAKTAGLSRVAEIAEELALSLAGPQSGNSMTLLDGITRIQSAIEQGPEPKLPPPPAPKDACVVTLEPGATLGEPAEWASDP